MGNPAVRIGIALWLAGCFYHATCQSAAAAPPPQSERASFGVYESFLRRVALQKNEPVDAQIDKPVLLNGEPVELAVPDVRDVAGMTDQDVLRLREIAIDCTAKTESLDRIARPLRFDYLIESIQSGQDASGALEQRLKDLQDQRDRVVREHVEQIKMALGDSRFEKLDAYLRAPIPGLPRAAAIKAR